MVSAAARSPTLTGAGGAAAPPRRHGAQRVRAQNRPRRALTIVGAEQIGDGPAEQPRDSEEEIDVGRTSSRLDGGQVPDADIHPLGELRGRDAGGLPEKRDL